MTVNDYKKQFLNKLPEFYDNEERLYLFYILMEEVMKFSKTDCILRGNDDVSIEKMEELDQVLYRLQNSEPIQHIFEKAYFYGYEFKVSPATLIPRRETEELVEWVLSEMKNEPQKNWRVLDIGTGTGCIPITIKKEFPLAVVSAIDVSVEALKIAKENAVNLKTDVTFIKQDILKTQNLDGYDIIISNPPYVRNLEKTEIKNNVLHYEPHLALFVEDNDPLIFYRKITQLAQKSLTENGMLFFEINQYLGNEMNEMVSEYFNTVELRKDLQGNERMMKIKHSANSF